MGPIHQQLEPLKPSAGSFPRYLWFGHVDAHEVHELADEEVEAEVFVDGVAVALQTSEEAEREEADGEADERHGDAHARDDGEEKLVDAPVALETNRNIVLKQQSRAYVETGTGFSSCAHPS